MPTPSRLAASWCLAGVLGALGVAAAPADAQTAPAPPAGADAPDAIDRLAGRTVVAIHLDVEGRRTDTPDLLLLLAVQPNRPLDLAELRVSMLQLQGAGRFEDIRVRGVASGAGVELIFDLVPRHPIDRLAFAGVPAALSGGIERDLTQRFNGLPPNAQIDAAARAAERSLAEHGYRQAKVRPTIQTFHVPERATLLLTADPGPLTVVTSARVEGASPLKPEDVLKRARVTVGQPYRSRDIDTGLDGIIEHLHSRGYYDAAASHTADVVSADGKGADVVITIDASVPVVLQFAGDPLPGRDTDLVPIKREGSADDDLLEDSVRRIESALRRDGYWKGRASFARSVTPSAKIITITVTRGARYRFERLEVAGNTQMTTDSIAALIALEPDAPYDESKVARGVAAMREVYRLKGYGAAKITATAETTAPAKVDGDPRVIERVVVEEGVQATVADVTVTGAVRLTSAEILGAMRLKRDAPYVAALVSGDRDAIRQKYDDRGFGTAAVDVRVTLNNEGSRAAVHVDVISEGPQTLLDDVVIVGNQRVSDETIRNAVFTDTAAHALQTGQPIGMSARLELQQRLSAMGIFRRVMITEAPHAGGDTGIDIIITVEESKTTTISFGGGLEAGLRARSVLESDGSIGKSDKLEIAPRASAEVGRTNLFGKNRSVSLFGGVSLRPIDDADNPERDGKCCGFSEYRVIGSFSEPRLFGWNARGLVSVTVEQAIRNSFNFLRHNTGVQMLRPLPGHVSFIGGYSLERVRLYNQQIADSERLLVDRVFPQVRLSVLSSGVLRDTRNDPLSPGGGNLLSADANLALRRIGSDLGYAKVFLQAFAYRRLPATRRVVLAGGARLGLMRGFVRDAPVFDAQGRQAFAMGEPVTTKVVDVHVSQRFFTGGSTTVRGFQQDRLGTPDLLDANGLSNGGNGLMVFNAEIRTAITREIGLATFLDTGNVFSRVNAMHFSELRTSVGAGVRYSSPIGPLRFDIGWKLGALRSTDSRRWEFHFSIGEAF